MTPPRDVQDYEAQAKALRQEIERCGFALVPAQLVRECDELIAAALRAASNAALERAAQVADEEHAEAWKSSRAADARGDHRVGAADAISASAAQRIAFVIRALIAPAPGSPPAPDPFEGHSEAEVYAALDEVRGKAPAADLRGLLMEARRFVSGERWATSAARRALIARIDAALSGTGATPSKEPPP